MILILAIILSLLCVVGTHKLIAMMSGDPLSKLYYHYLLNAISFTYLLYMSAVLFAVYFLLLGGLYNAWIR